MKALVIIDAQNEFSHKGKRPVPGYAGIIESIKLKVSQARNLGIPIAWVRHANLPTEPPAFVPGTWGYEYECGFGPLEGSELEKEFKKVVYGAFSGSDIGSWLKSIHADEILLMGFYTHGCVSTTAREAIMAGIKVTIDPNTTGACLIYHDLLGMQIADEVRRTFNMGAHITDAALQNNYAEDSNQKK
jgi:nicotinamidase-related amidase